MFYKVKYLHTNEVIGKALICAFIVFSCIWFHPIYSQPIMSEITEAEIKFMHEVYSLSFDKADSILISHTKISSDRSALLMMRSYQAWWRILSGDRIKENVELCKRLTDETLSLLKKEKNYDINSALKYVSVYSLKSRLDNLYSKSLRSTVHFYNSIEHIKKLSMAEEKGQSILFVMGMYIYSVEYIQSNYFFNLKLLPNPENLSKETAIEYLEMVALSDNKILKTEATYFLMKIYSELENRPHDAIVKADKLIGMYPDNYVFHIEKLKLLRSLKRQNEAMVLKNDLMKNVRNSNKLNTAQKKHFVNLLKEINF
jgi:hypothetical protein